MSLSVRSALILCAALAPLLMVVAVAAASVMGARNALVRAEAQRLDASALAHLERALSGALYTAGTLDRAAEASERQRIATTLDEHLERMSILRKSPLPLGASPAETASLGRAVEDVRADLTHRAALARTGASRAISAMDDEISSGAALALERLRARLAMADRAVSEPLERAKSATGSAIATLSGAGLAALAAGLFAGLILVRRALAEPLKSLRDSAQTIGSARTLIPLTERKDEIGDLARTLQTLNWRRARADRSGQAASLCGTNEPSGEPTSTASSFAKQLRTLIRRLDSVRPDSKPGNMPLAITAQSAHRPHLDAAEKDRARLSRTIFEDVCGVLKHGRDEVTALRTRAETLAGDVALLGEALRRSSSLAREVHRAALMAAAAHTPQPQRSGGSADRNDWQALALAAEAAARGQLSDLSTLRGDVEAIAGAQQAMQGVAHDVSALCARTLCEIEARRSASERVIEHAREELLRAAAMAPDEQISNGAHADVTTHAHTSIMPFRPADAISAAPASAA